MDNVTNERWLPIPDYEDRYEVSDQGSVRSLRATRGPRPSPKVKSSYVGKNGYPTVGLSRDYAGESMCVHWLIMLAFVGPKPDGMEIRHLNGDRMDCRLENLRYGTSAENSADMARHGTNSYANKTHCPQGHPYSGANLYETPNRTNRVCRTCHLVNQRARRNRQRAAGLPVT